MAGAAPPAAYEAWEDDVLWDGVDVAAAPLDVELDGMFH